MIQQKQRHKKYNQRPNMDSINNSPMSDSANRIVVSRICGKIARSIANAGTDNANSDRFMPESVILRPTLAQVA
jgi:hypothetical protein